MMSFENNTSMKRSPTTRYSESFVHLTPTRICDRSNISLTEENALNAIVEEVCIHVQVLLPLNNCLHVP
mgnify:CR=1 FL=1